MLRPAQLSQGQHLGDHLAQETSLIRQINKSVLKDVEEINQLLSPWSAEQHGEKVVQQVYRPSSALYLSPQFLIRDVPVLLHQVFDLSQNPIHFWRGIRPQFPRLQNRLHSLHNLSEGKIQALTENTLQWQTERHCYEEKMHMPYVLHQQHFKKLTELPLPTGILKINISHVILGKGLNEKGSSTKESQSQHPHSGSKPCSPWLQHKPGQTHFESLTPHVGWGWGCLLRTRFCQSYYARW